MQGKLQLPASCWGSLPVFVKAGWMGRKGACPLPVPWEVGQQQAGLQWHFLAVILQEEGKGMLGSQRQSSQGGGHQGAWRKSGPAALYRLLPSLGHQSALHRM